MEYHDVPPQQRPGNINAAPRFIEPQVHPDIDNYFREKLAQAIEIKQQTDKVRANKKFAQRLDTKEAKEVLLAALAKAGEIEDVEEVFRELNKDGADRSLSPDGEIQRIQDLWRAAERGDFTGASREITQHISNVTNEIREHRQNTHPSIQEDVSRYDRSVAELAEWHATLQETPVNVNSRLGRQISRTVVGLIHQRDSTIIGGLNKQLKSLQRTRQAITTISQTPGR